MLGIVFKLFFIAVCAVTALFMLAGTLRKSRLLNRRIEDFKAEQDELRRSGRSADPYSALAELYAARSADVRPKRPSSGKGPGGASS